MEETWRPAIGWERYLEVSDFGNVRYLAREYLATRGGTCFLNKRPAAPASQCIGRHGYAEVAIQVEGTRKKLTVHRLVALAFVDGYEPGLSVNHINGVKSDNRAENLEWVSLAENTRHQWRTGLVDLRGDNNPGRKLSSGQVRIMRRLLAQGIPANQLAVLARVSSSAVYMIRDGKRWNSLPPETA